MNSLLVEYFPFKSTLTEVRKGTFEVKGICQRAGKENQNNRVYDKRILAREVDKYMDTFVKQGNAYGELDHPDSQVVNLKNASHVVKDLYWEGDDLIGVFELLNTPSGNIVKEILKGGHTIGTSSRGAGTVKQTNEGYLEVDDDFELICWDFVSNPSTHGAFMYTTTLNEGRNPQMDKYAKAHTLVQELLCLTANKCELK
jgi:hypothetical protein